MMKSNDKLGFLHWRIESLQELGSGLSFRELVQLWLPGSRRPPKVNSKYQFLQNERAKKKLTVHDEESILLFDKPFYHRKNYKEIVGLIQEIVVDDAYRAKRFLKEDSIVIDAGAMLGVFSVLAAHMCPKGKVYSFEPSAVTNTLFRRTAVQYPNIVVEQLGLGEASKRADLMTANDEETRYIGGNFISDSDIVQYGALERSLRLKKEEIKVVSIDEYVARHNLPRVDFIKMDTEGYERNILRGAKATIQKYKPVVAMSAYHTERDAKELPELLKSLADYTIERHGENFICN